ncbi:MAG: DUF1801 domain-containing protein [Pyrinomonadaceae bacterium]
MAKAELKTKQTDGSVGDFLNGVADVRQRADSFKLLEIFEKTTGEKPRMWGAAVIGFGHQLLKYDSGRELDWMITGFSPRKTNLTLYILNESAKGSGLLERLGKHKTGKGCLYIKQLSDVDELILTQMIEACVRRAKSGG